MLSDRAPYEYRYLSRRLLTDLVQHDEAARGRWQRGFDIKLPLLGLALQRRPPDLTNLHDLAMQSAGLVSDHTGGLDVPGSYVHARMELRHGIFSPHMGWLGGQVACYCGVSTTSNGDVFVALFGSASNVVGRRSRDEGESGSFCPSDIAGLYELLDAVRERDDPEIDLDYRLDDHTMSDASRVERAIMFATEGTSGDVQPFEFLARVYLDVDDGSAADAVYRRVIIGVPLWIATPRRLPSPDGRRSSRRTRLKLD